MWFFFLIRKFRIFFLTERTRIPSNVFFRKQWKHVEEELYQFDSSGIQIYVIANPNTKLGCEFKFV